MSLNVNKTRFYKIKFILELEYKRTFFITKSNTKMLSIEMVGRVNLLTYQLVPSNVSACRANINYVDTIRRVFNK